MNELALRLVMGVVCLNHLLIRPHFVPGTSARAAPTVRPAVWERLSRLRNRRYLLFQLLLSGTNLPIPLYVAAPWVRAWSTLRRPAWLGWVGVAVGLAASELFAWSHAALAHGYAEYFRTSDESGRSTLGLTIDTTGLTPQAVAQKILDRLNHDVLR